MGRHRSGYVRIDVSDVLEEIEDVDLKAEYCDRFGSEPDVDFDLLAEIHRELLLGRVQYALAMIESAQNARRVGDDERQRQFQRQRAPTPTGAN